MVEYVLAVTPDNTPAGAIITFAIPVGLFLIIGYFAVNLRRRR